jgi:hypothetical protein
MNVIRLIKFYFKPKGEMTAEELSVKAFAVQSKFYKSLSKAEIFFYWSFRIIFMLVALGLLNYILNFFSKN